MTVKLMSLYKLSNFVPFLLQYNAKLTKLLTPIICIYSISGWSLFVYRPLCFITQSYFLINLDLLIT